MSIVEKLGGKPGQQTISEVVGGGSFSGTPFVGNFQTYVAGHADATAQPIQAYGSIDGAEARLLGFFEIDDEAFDTLSKPILYYTIEDGKTHPDMIDTAPVQCMFLKTRHCTALDPDDFPDSKVILEDVDVLEYHDEFLFRKGTLHVSGE